MNAESEKPDDTMSPGAEQPAENVSNGLPDGASNTAATALDPLAEAQAEAAEHKDKMLRTLAELENFRRRAEKERQDVSKYAITAFARDCLTVVDNLRRGLESVTAEERQANPALETLAAGMELTEREMLATLERHGIEKIVPLDEPFDHNLHQSMLEMEDATKPAGSIVQVMQAGYVLNGRLLRPALVAVAKGGPKAGADVPSPTVTVHAPIANEDLANPPQGTPESGGNDEGTGNNGGQRG
ncbi:MAG: molecular chaperone GrpE [Alphaproteobacteria bacterium]|jgi:molecular chaperone GrpE